MAKRSLETGEDIDSIPESMRTYLAMQAMESGKGMGSAFLDRTGLGSYAPGIMFGEQGPQGKVGEWLQTLTDAMCLYEYLLTIVTSNHPPVLQVPCRGQVDSSWPEHHGSDRLLFP